MATPIVRIQPVSVVASRDRLWLQTVVYNLGTEPIFVDRDAVTLTLADGRTLAIVSHHPGYTIAPHDEHKVYFDFEAEDFAWKNVPSAQVNWTGAVTIQGQIVALPPMFVSPKLVVSQPTYVTPAQPTYYSPPAAPTPTPLPAATPSPAPNPTAIPAPAPEGDGKRVSPGELTR